MQGAARCPLGRRASGALGLPRRSVARALQLRPSAWGFKGTNGDSKEAAKEAAPEPLVLRQEEGPAVSAPTPPPAAPTPGPAHAELVELVVADDLQPSTSEAAAAVPKPRARARRAVPAARSAAVSLAANLGAAKTQAESGMGASGRAPANGGGPGLSAQLAQLLHLQSGDSGGGVRPELSLSTQPASAAKLELDLRAAETQLAAKDSEIGQLRGQLAEREGKLRAARADLMEARMAAQEKDAALEQAYDRLAAACQERSRLRSELVYTQTELTETRAELEALADDILSIRDLMDSIDGEEDGASASAAAAGWPAPGAAGRGEGEEALDVLQNLAAFSRQMLSDATEDAEVYAAASKLAAAGEAWRGDEPGAAPE